MRTRLLGRQLADVERDVEVERVLAVADDRDVLRIRPEGLHRLHEPEFEPRLVLSEEHEDAPLARLQAAEVVGLHVLEIDEEILVGHGASLGHRP